MKKSPCTSVAATEIGIPMSVDRNTPTMASDFVKPILSMIFRRESKTAVERAKSTAAVMSDKC